MDIISSKVSMHPETFAPIVELVVQIPLEALVDGKALLGEDELASVIGTEFISAWKRHKGIS